MCLDGTFVPFVFRRAACESWDSKISDRTWPFIWVGCGIPYNFRIVGAMSKTLTANPISRTSFLIFGPIAMKDPGTSSPSSKSCLAMTGVLPP